MDSLTKIEIDNYAKLVNGTAPTKDKRHIVYEMASKIFTDRNAIYKDAWRDYRPGTFIDRNLVKAKRLRELDELGLKEEVLEQALDQVNELLFLAILILEAKENETSEE